MLLVSKLLRLPKDALPYVPSALAPQHVEYRLRENPESGEYWYCFYHNEA